ncbi:arf-GAP with Rho-GAP domain, ANK repeat and PH domain-containing protein 2 isoform X2 [Megalops cyprinoides]|uniref:arf-GAP with Rho-GAP domain, ANK repeat and PH domain-containing protein 2 isoform X2 n=1 Tax=Megalops cyprinoides TaxID=118141 RepID=UPI001864AA25|nr:arf-GAP with Rho-GAP domain, ANK repeat and PH domain-containing protein 2 isoform X2 [Megalops cyprinoides]
MSTPTQSTEEIRCWLSSIHLSQYTGCFEQAGYRRLEDCGDLTNDKLLAMRVFPTGHRRRILVSLESPSGRATPERGPGERERVKPVPKPRRVFLRDRKKASSCQHQQRYVEPESSQGRQTLPAGVGLGGMAAEGSAHRPTPARMTPSTSGSSDSLCVSSHSDRETSSEEHAPSPPTGFQGEMVVNEIYNEGWDANCAPKPRPRPTRSYKLRHRPVPDIPDQTLPTPVDWNIPQENSSQSISSTEPPPALNARQKAPLVRTLSPICPYGETFLYNNPDNILDLGTKELLKKEITEKIKHKKIRKKQAKTKGPAGEGGTQRTDSGPGGREVHEDEYSTVEECNASLKRSREGLPDALCDSPPTPELYSLVRRATPAQPDHAISPYACFYGPTKTVLKMGWLDKLSPQGNYVYQKRWVKFDGEKLTYYNNDKEMYSKGLIPTSAMTRVRGLGDNKFEVVTSQRTFVFRAERGGDKYDWINALQIAMRTRSPTSPKPSKCSLNKCGYMELRGCKGRVFVSLMGHTVRLCKTEQDFKAGLAITVIDLTAAHVKDVERKCFEVNTPFKTFSFTAESEREKEEWIEAVQESIAETLSDYEVAEKIWFSESNRICADCGAPRPEWASINLGVVICKKCAGQHRSFGPSISQVRSLKLDSSVWSNELVELFLDVGNKNANSFWAASLPPEEALHPEASPEQRASLLRRKYKERKYTQALTGFTSQEQLNKALCAAVVQSDVLKTMSLVFSGADVMCATGDPTFCTPYLLAQRAGQRLQMEFLYHNKLSDFPKLDPVYEKRFPRDASLFLHGFLYKSVNAAKSLSERRGKDEMTRVWCTLEGGFISYYEREKMATPTGRLDISEVVTLAVSRTETMTENGAVFTFETYLLSERTFLFGAETQESHTAWAQAIAKCFIPPTAVHMLSRDYDLIGRLYYKEGHDLYHWKLGWFLLEKSSLFFCSGAESEGESRLQLKRLQELTVSTHTDGEEVLLMVESGRTVYIRGFTRLDFALWHSAIRQAAGTESRALSSQQLSKNNVPIIVDSCIAFATQYGLCHEGIYQKNGHPQRVAQLLESFRKDARNVKLRAGEHQLEDVSDVLKSFLSQTEDALLTKELYPFWVSVLDLEDEKARVGKYRTFIQSLPQINRTTLSALLQHLYRIQKCSGMNQMPTSSLASVFSSCLFQTEGQTRQEICVVEDLINNYVELFDVHEDQVKQMETENSFITKWKDTMFSPAGDLIFEVYLERKEPESCCLVKVSPTMRSDELADMVLEMKSMEVNEAELWTTFEAIENGELERPLHYKEKVLEQVLEWGSLEDPSSAFLIIKKFVGAKMADIHKECTKELIRGENLKFKDGSSKLLSGHKFLDRYVILREERLCLYKDMKSAKPEKEVPVSSVRCYLGLKRKMKPPTSWGFTVYMEKQQWHFCCDSREAQTEWVTDILRAKHGGELWPRDRSQRPPAVQKSTRGGAVAPVQRNTRTTEPKVKKETEVKPGGLSPGTCSEDQRGAASRSPFLQKSSLVGECLKNREASFSPSTRRKGALATPAGTPPRCHSPQGPGRSLQKKAVLGREGQMPASLLHELNSVLSKTGRSAREEQD